MATILEALAIAVEHHQAGRLAQAEPIYRQILAADPNQPEARHLLGVIAHQVGNHEIAVECIQRAIQLKPGEADFHNNLGEAYRALHRIAEAMACYRRALQLRPDLAEAHNNLGLALTLAGSWDEAVAAYHRALELQPDSADAHNNLGVLHKDRGELNEAAACYRRALALKPDFAGAHNNLGNVFYDQGNLPEALECYRQALAAQPHFAQAHNNLGNILKALGELDGALACYRRALELNADYAQTHSNLLLTLQYGAGVTPAALAEVHAEYEQRHAAPLRGSLAPHPNSPEPQRRLRLGFVSPDLGRHPVGYFIVRALENLSPDEYETVCYSDRAVNDAVAQRIHAAATQWCEVMGMADQALAERIRADRIDVLFDLAGHTARNRLLVFARRPAPIQVTWAGYVGTTGLTAMDYLLADRFQVPPGAEQSCRERVLRMPDGYVCYDPPADAPPVSPPPAATRGFVTFGSYNNPAKIGPLVVQRWAQILRRVPSARLRLKFRGFNHAEPARRLIEAFAAEVIDPARVELCGPSPHAEFLAAYNEIDVALDPFPYSGGLTTCEALWMGVPVITCPGETFASRHSLSHLSNVGLMETIARNGEEYVEIAVALAGDLPRLSAIRAGLRAQMAASPLCDGPRFAQNLAARLRDVWRRWCAGNG